MSQYPGETTSVLYHHKCHLFWRHTMLYHQKYYRCSPYRQKSLSSGIAYIVLSWLYRFSGFFSS